MDEKIRVVRTFEVLLLPLKVKRTHIMFQKEIMDILFSLVHIHLHPMRQAVSLQSIRLKAVVVMI